MTPAQIAAANASLRANWTRKQSIIDHYNATGMLPLAYRIKCAFWRIFG
jgi:hypothetical protein